MIEPWTAEEIEYVRSKLQEGWVCTKIHESREVFNRHAVQTFYRQCHKHGIAYSSSRERHVKRDPTPPEPHFKRLCIRPPDAPHRTTTARLMGDPPPGRTPWS